MTHSQPVASPSDFIAVTCSGSEELSWGATSDQPNVQLGVTIVCCDSQGNVVGVFPEQIVSTADKVAWPVGTGHYLGIPRYLTEPVLHLDADVVYLVPTSMTAGSTWKLSARLGATIDERECEE